MVPALFTDCLDFWRRSTPEKPAFYFNDEMLTYEDFCRWTDGVAAMVRARGVQIGEVVNITGDNSLEWLAALIGLVKAGAIPAGLNQRSVPAEYAYLIERSGARLVFADAVRREVLAKVKTTTAFEIMPLEEINSYREGAAWTHPRVSPDDPIVLVFTSGSTGHPKAVIHTHTTFMSAAIERQMVEPAYCRDMVQLFVLSLYGNGGSISGSFNSLFHGGALVVEPNFEAARALMRLEQRKVTVFSGVPLVFEQIAALPAFKGARLDELKAVMTGGARVSRELLEAWRGKGVHLRQLYGQTELGIVASVSTDEETLSGAETCGRGGPLTTLRIARPDGAACAPGEAGEIRAKTPSATRGYWGDPDATAKLFDDEGWLRTGDIGTMDATGLLRFVDRAKDMIISGGFNISASEIENAIMEVPGVDEVAVIAAKDQKFDETPMAVVYAAKGLDPMRVVEHCNERLSNYKVPRYVAVVSTPLPRMTSGKINKPKLRAEYADAHERLPKLR